MQSNFLLKFKDAQSRAAKTKTVLKQLGCDSPFNTSPEQSTIKASKFVHDDIYSALLNLSEVLANSYAQVKEDIENETRLSWAGSAHEIREVLRTMLELLAPDSEIVVSHWYEQDKNTSGPTQKQRVLYILRKQGAGSKEQDVVKKVVSLEEMIGDLVRATYSRSSDAAHRFKTRKEVRPILKYFEAFAHDLLNLD